jgi:hypothetical protein
MASVSRGFLEENLWKCFRKIAPLPLFLRSIETRDVSLPGYRNFVNALAGVYCTRAYVQYHGEQVNMVNFISAFLTKISSE